jgi:YVTN family beta-propeller protein
MTQFRASPFRRSVALGILSLLGGTGAWTCSSTNSSSTGPGPGPATKLAFAVQPGTAQASSPFGPVAIVAHDAQGNTASSFTGAVTLALGNNPGGSTLSGLTTQAAISGVVFFAPLSLDHVGTGYTLTATASGLTGSSSSAFDVLPSHPQLGAVVATPALGGQPYGVAVSAGGAVIVARVSGDSITRYNLPDTTRVVSLAAGSQPVHVAINPAGTRAYVVNQGGAAVHVVNLTNNTVIDSAPLTNAGFNIAVAPNGLRVFVTTSDGRVYVLNTSTNAIIDSMRVGSSPNGLAFAPGGAQLYISSRDAGTVTVFNAQSDAPIDTFSVGGAPQRIAVTPDGGTLFVANEAGGVNIVALPSGTVTGPIALDGSAYGLGISPDGERLYVTNPLSGKIFVVNVATHQVILTQAIGGQPRNVAFDLDGTTAVVTDGQGRVLFIR